MTTKAKRKVARKPMKTRAAVAAPPPKKYFKSPTEGIWIECDYDPDQGVYDNCHEIPASQVPQGAGGDQ